MDQGFPGTKKVSVRYALDQQNRVTVTYHAESDATTVINLSQHSYFNLGGHAAGHICGHRRKIMADSYTKIDHTMIPTGKFASVVGTPLDSRDFKSI